MWLNFWTYNGVSGSTSECYWSFVLYLDMGHTVLCGLKKEKIDRSAIKQNSTVEHYMSHLGWSVSKHDKAIFLTLAMKSRSGAYKTPGFAFLQKGGCQWQCHWAQDAKRFQGIAYYSIVTKEKRSTNDVTMMFSPAKIKRLATLRDFI